MREQSTTSHIYLLTVFCSLLNLGRAAPASIWDVNIFRGPAPPPDEGPPLSADALRDTSKLKYEIIGIVGAYLFWLSLTVTLLCIVGRKLRRRQRLIDQIRNMETVKPAPIATTTQVVPEPPLRSPGKMASLRSFVTGGKGHSRMQSTVTVSTIDEKILESDKQKNLDEMAKLYAAVMAHDEERSNKARSSGQTSPQSPRFPQQNAPPTPKSVYTTPPTPLSPYYNPHLNAPASPRSPQYPPEFQHLRNTSEPPSQGIDSMAFASQIRHPMAPTPDDYSSTAPTLSASRPSSRKTKASPLSLASARSDSADQNKRRPSAISVRGQPISQPLPSAALSEISMQSGGLPSSPRAYHPGPPPPVPADKDEINVLVKEVGGDHHGAASLSMGSQAASSSSNSLPFRQFYADQLKSAPATKTTFVDRRESRMGAHPKTGVPQTPYSPYTPFTPMTPITPRHLVTKAEMKRNRKLEGMKVLSEDDMVKSDEEMWGK